MPQISKAVKQDHELVKDAYWSLRHTPPDERGNPNGFIWMLDRYLIVEDLVLTPALDNHVARGGERHRRLSDDYDSINEKLRHMQRFPPADASFDAALRSIWIDLEPHLREEATQDLIRLEEGMSRPESEALGRKYDIIKGLLQKPYGQDGTPDARTLAAILETSRQDLRTKIGILG